MLFKRWMAPSLVAALVLARQAPAQNQTPDQADVNRMMAALPTRAPGELQNLRRVLVLAKADEYIHASIPLAARTIEALGKRTSAWATTISYDPDDITAENLHRYNAVFLDSTTGHFLDDANNEAATTARRAALLDFVRSGKGLAGIHAASDSYHTPGKRPWPEFNRLIGGIFAGHPWQHVWVKIDDPKSPITAAFKGQPFEITDETYTFMKDVYSRENVHVLLSIDTSKMTPDEAAKENRPWDHDYALSWIRREGKGRVFYTAHGHREQIYAMTPMLEHILAGMQYVLGDLKADDSPSAKK